MIKVKIDNIIPREGFEIQYFTVLSAEDGPCGTFRLIQRGAKNINIYDIGQELELTVKPITVPTTEIIEEVKIEKPKKTSISDKIKNFKNPK